MKTILGTTAAAALLLAGCSKNEAPASDADADADYGSGNPVTAPVDYLGTVAQAQKHAVRQIDLASLKQAIQMFQVSEGRLPKDLNEIVTKEYLPKMPQPPAGSRIIYDPKTGKVDIRSE